MNTKQFSIEYWMNIVGKVIADKFKRCVSSI